MPKTDISPFSDKERAVLHMLAREFENKTDMDKLRNVLREGATITLLVQAYRTQKNMIAWLKGASALIVVVGAAWGVCKSLWPEKF